MTTTHEAMEELATERRSAFNPTKALIKSILENPTRHEWSVQGFGMLRTYLDADKVWRLNMWDSTLAVKNVSTLHDHPWHFTSWVVAGRFTNVRFEPVEDAFVPGHHGIPSHRTKWWSHATIKTGPGGGMRTTHSNVRLYEHHAEHYAEGCVYQQKAQEIHESQYEDGTVTINERLRLEDGEHAKVFWPIGQEWVDAEPREASRSEVAFCCERSLRKWFVGGFHQALTLSPVRSAC